LFRKKGGGGEEEKNEGICIVYIVNKKTKYLIPIRMNEKIFGIRFFCIIKK
jgi:hypothetical protein